MKQIAWFIDDERDPPFKNDDEWEWVVIRNERDWGKTICELTDAFPSFVSFDHDLGSDDFTGLDVVKDMIDMDLDCVTYFPDDFQFYVHSQNPVGKTNIEELLTAYLNFKRIQKIVNEVPV